MDYSNKLLLRDYLKRMDEQYRHQAISSKQYRILISLLAQNPMIELYDFPELFSSLEEYEQYYSEDIPEDQFTEHDSDKLEQMLYMMLYTQAGRYPLREEIIPRFEENYLFDQARHDIASAQAKSLRDFTEKQRQTWTNTMDQQYNTKKILSTINTQKQKLQDLLEQQARQRDNILQHTVELTKPEKKQRKYKQWIWTPNAHTRHPLMADVVVPVDEPFHVISTQYHCPDCYMDVPLDITGPICQIANCKCFQIYTNSKDGI